MTSDQKKFKVAYVIQNTSHDFEGLLELCERIEFVTTGYEKEDNLLPSIVKRLKEFNPLTDIVVPVGNVPANLLAGAVVASFCLRAPVVTFTMAIYKEKQYHIQSHNLWEVTPDMEAPDVS